MLSPLRLALLSAFAAFLLAGVILALFFTVFRPAGVQASTTLLTIISGDVQVREAGRSSFRTAVDGEELEVGDTVRTSRDGRAVITYFEGSTVELEPQTELTLQRLAAPAGGRSIGLSQVLGTTWHRVLSVLEGPSEYEVETPAAVAAVRDTLFLVAVERDGTTVVKVTQGTVAVTAAGREVVVRAGEETTVRPGQPPTNPVTSPPPLSEIQLQLSSPAWILAIDPAGLAVGIAPPGIGVNQVPGAQSDERDAEPQDVLIPNPRSGTYVISIEPKGAGGTYTLTASGLNQGRVVFNESVAGNVGSEERWEAQLTVEVREGRITGGSLSAPRLARGRSPARFVLTREALTRAQERISEVLPATVEPRVPAGSTPTTVPTEMKTPVSGTATATPRRVPTPTATRLRPTTPPPTAMPLPPPPTATLISTLTLNPASGPPGVTISALGASFAPNQPVLVAMEVEGGVAYAEACTTRSDGTFDCRLQVPFYAVPGRSYPVRAQVTGDGFAERFFLVTPP